MAMAENESGDDRKELNESVSGGGGPKSPWKNPVDKAAAAVAAAADTPVMGAEAEAWPPLSDAQRTKIPDSPSKLSASDDANSGAQPTSSNVQGSAGQHKGSNSSHKHGQNRHHRNGSKRNQNSVPPFPVHHVPYYQPVLPHVFPPVVPSPVPLAGYGYQPCPPLFPAVENQISKANSETPMQGFVSPSHAIDASVPPQGDPNVNGPTTTSRRPNGPEVGAHPYPLWHYPRTFGPRDGMMQQAMARAYARPPFFGPAPPFVGGPNFPGAPSVYYISPVRAPYPPRFAPHPLSPLAPMPPEVLALRDSIVKQIEYYFSDENLQTDRYLISQMNEQGWVSISVIADFKRVKRMSTDIPFILDALQSSRAVEVQADKVRKRDNWSKYIAAVECSSPVKVQVSKDQTAGVEINHVENNIQNEGRNDVATETSAIFSASSDNLAEVSRNDDKLEGANSFSGYQDCEKAVNSSDKQALVSEKPYSHQKLSSRSSIKHSIPDVRNSFLAVNQFKASKSTRVSSNEADVEDQGQSVVNLDDLSSDFSGTFMLDEELEMEHKFHKKGLHNSLRRIEDEDDEILVNDQDVERLVIVTQNSSMLGAGSKVQKSNTISNELASAINDGLYFYEQELKAKRSHRRKMNPNTESKDGSSRSPNTSTGVYIRSAEISSRSHGDEVGNPSNRRKQSKGSAKQHSSHKQRFFSSNFRNHGGGRNSFGVISESPPSNSIGFFFSSTPPENSGLRSSKLSASPHGIVTGSSPPVGSMPKSFPPFQHPSHQLLEENGFKQQK